MKINNNNYNNNDNPSSSSYGGINDNNNHNETSKFLPSDTKNDYYNTTTVNSTTTTVTTPSFFHYTINIVTILFMIIGSFIGVAITLGVIHQRNKHLYVAHYYYKIDKPFEINNNKDINETLLSDDDDDDDDITITNSKTVGVRIRPACTYYYNDPLRSIDHIIKKGKKLNDDFFDDDKDYKIHNENSKNRKDEPIIIQTSMDEPSQPWTTIKCFPEKYPAHINAFDIPDAVLHVNFNNTPKFPPIIGFGGAFTEAAALNYNQLSYIGQDTVLELLFGKDGLGYNIGRFHINSCDFSLQSYSFDTDVDDLDLIYFDTNVTHDMNVGMIPFALRAKRVYDNAWGNNNNDTETEVTRIDSNSTNYTEDNTNNTNNTNNNNDMEVFRFFASPWSPPNWMKLPTFEDEKSDLLYALKMTYSNEPNCLRDGVNASSDYANAWAKYFSKFITAYHDHGIDIWAVTVQNEPEFPAPWEACSYSAINESDFVAYHLGPILHKDHPTVHILGFDHNKDHINTWVNTLFSKTMAHHEHYKSASKYMTGTAYHWYAGGMDRLLDGAVGAANLHRLQDNYQKLGIDTSNHILLGSEACHCPTTGYAGGDIYNYWARAERYAHTILADLAAGSNGWVEWNFILDSIGGPNHLHNLCDSTILSVPHRDLNHTRITSLPDFEITKPMGDGETIIGDDRTREEMNTYGFAAKYLDVGVAVQPLYYYIGHITRYVRPGSYSVHGLVNQPFTTNGDSGKIFQSIDSVVVGGGINDLARNGIEITVWPCEGSTRQHFVYNHDIQSKDVNMYKRVQVLGHDWLGAPTKSCFSRMNEKDLLGITLTDCTSQLAGMYDIVKIENDIHNRYYIKLLNPVVVHKKTKSTNTDTSKTKTTLSETECLYILELGNSGGSYGPRGGAQVALGDCSNESAKWILDIDYGIVSSYYFTPPESNANTTTTNATNTTTIDNETYKVCMTTGWPFLQMGAFIKTSAQKKMDNNNTDDTDIDKTVVILNEARESANYVLYDEEDDVVILSGSIPPRSIQTILF